jgi:hypothetical protein
MFPRYYIFWAVLLLTCGYALLRGRKYERLTALVCLLASVVSVLARSPVHQRYVGVEAGDLVVDTAVLFAFVAIALRSDRFWPLWVAGLQLTMNLSHFLKALDSDLIPQAYAVAERFWSYPILLILAVGTWRGHRRRRKEPVQGLAPAA